MRRNYTIGALICILSYTSGCAYLRNQPPIKQTDAERLQEMEARTRSLEDIFKQNFDRLKK